MEHKFTVLTNEEIIKLTPEELKVQLEQMQDAYNKLNSMGYEIAAKKLSEVVC